VHDGLQPAEALDIYQALKGEYVGPVAAMPS
jgi:hypothetical protein